MSSGPAPMLSAPHFSAGGEDRPLGSRPIRFSCQEVRRAQPSAAIRLPRLLGPSSGGTLPTDACNAADSVGRWFGAEDPVPEAGGDTQAHFRPPQMMDQVMGAQARFDRRQPGRKVNPVVNHFVSRKTGQQSQVEDHDGAKSKRNEQNHGDQRGRKPGADCEYRARVAMVNGMDRELQTCCRYDPSIRGWRIQAASNSASRRRTSRGRGSF